MSDIPGYFTKTLLQLFSDSNETVSALALQLSLDHGIQNNLLTLTELLEHPNPDIRSDALRLFQEIEELELRKSVT